MQLYIFDMGGVAAGNVMCIPAMAARLGIDQAAFFRGAGSDPDATHTSPYNLGDVAELMKGTISPELFWERFSERTGLPVSEDLWGSCFAPVPIESTYAAIAALKARGRRVVCGTNSLHAHYEIHAARGEYACFDAVYASHKLGAIKPDPAFFRAILDAEGRAAEESCFVDDHPENVRAAEACGLRAHRYVDAAGLAAAIAAWEARP